MTGNLEFQNGVVANAGSITLTAATAQILNGLTGTSALAKLAANSVLGSLSLPSGQVLATATNLINAGKTTVGSGSGFSVGGSYMQTAGMITVDAGVDGALRAYPAEGHAREQGHDCGCRDLECFRHRR